MNVTDCPKVEGFCDEEVICVVVGEQPANRNQMTGVLPVDHAITTQRNRRVSGIDGPVEKDPLRLCAARLDSVQISVLIVAIDDAIRVHCGSIHAPFESIGMALVDRRVFVLPLWNQVRI